MNSRFQCLLCGVEYGQALVLAHLISQHGKPPVQCVCGVVTTTLQEMQFHQKQTSCHGPYLSEDHFKQVSASIRQVVPTSCPTPLDARKSDANISENDYMVYLLRKLEAAEREIKVLEQFIPMPEYGCLNLMALDGFNELWNKHYHLRDNNLFEPPMRCEVHRPVRQQLRGWRRPLILAKEQYCNHKSRQLHPHNIKN